jgi:hypothetical protein
MEEYDAFNSDAERSTIKVHGPSGAAYEVIHESEKDYWESIVTRYLHDYRFTNINDLQDLDRVVSTELLLYRYQLWLQLEKDYWGQSIDISETNKYTKEKSAELRQIKKALGIEKSAREKDQGDSVAAYIEDLRVRAHEFGVMRNEQAEKAITLWQELIALMTFHDKCTPQERKEQHIEIEDLIKWIRMTIPEFQEIDKKFRETTQKYWIAEQ